MYKIIGADEKEYGPVTAEQIKQWLAEGRVNAHTRVWSEATGWRPLAEFGEFASAGPAQSPFAPPPLSPASPTPAGFEAAAQQVRGPAIFILVLAVLDIFTALMGLAWMVFQSAMPNVFNLQGADFELQQRLSMVVGLPANLIGLALSIVCLIGALRMMKLKTYGFAMTAAIITLIPCGTCCCLANLGAGIWALIVLSKPEVKSQFT